MTFEGSKRQIFDGKVQVLANYAMRIYL